MNLHELPMIIFTVLAQMSVGAFLILGVVQLWLSAKTDQKTVDRLTVPILYVIGPTLVLGLIASMFHMNDVSNVLNVFRHVGSSWLSREIVFGILFAGCGFLFALMQWFRIGSTTIRQIIGVITALLGIALIISMAMIYMSLDVVPAWDTPIVVLHFFGTAIMLGALAVAAAQLATSMIRLRTNREYDDHTRASDADVDHREAERKSVREREPALVTAHGSSATDIADRPATTGDSRTSRKDTGKDTLGIRRNTRAMNAPTTDTEWSLVRRMVQGLAILAAITGVIILISYIFHILNLATGNPTAQASAEAFTGTFFIIRLALLGLAAIVLAIFIYKMAGQTVRENPAALTTLVVIAFLLVLASELMGRSLHYDSMQRIGI